MTNIEAFDQTAWSALEIGLPVDEIAPMKRFYSEGLGFKPAGHVDLPSAHIEALRFGDCLLKLTPFLDVERRPEATSARSIGFLHHFKGVRFGSDG